MDLLTELADKYGTTKGNVMHLYTPFYHRLFNAYRQTTKKVLEIGIDKYYSHFMWRDYFPNAKIYGMDFIPKPPQPGIDIFIGNQANREHLKSMMDKFGGDFDIIIDDGGHQMAAQQISLGFLFKYLKTGGVYIIEDLFTCFWGPVGGVLPDGSNSTLLFLERMLNNKEVKSEYLTKEEAALLQDEISGDTLKVEIYKRKEEKKITGPGIVPFDTHITAALTKIPF